jgi:DNA polymerase I
MTDMKKAFLFICDYTGLGNDQMFLWSEGNLIAASADQLVQEAAELVCHDYWLIAPSIYGKAKKLPTFVTDIEELRITSSGRKEARVTRDRSETAKSLSGFVDERTLSDYANIFNRKIPVDLKTLSLVGQGLLQYAEKVKADAIKADEWDRYVHVERGVSDYLIRSAANGLAIDTTKLRQHKREIDFDYYMALKQFSATHSMPLEPPSDEDIVSHLEAKGFNFDGVSVDYVLHFVPMTNNFARDVLQLRKIHATRKVLTAIPFSQTRIFPIVDSFGSITSRIYFKDPSLQNLAKRHRDILKPDAETVFSYVDYDQYEAGIMAALSKDKLLLELYAAGDLYEQAAEQIFPTQKKRKEAKRLFLSFAYGMKRKNLIAAAVEYGAQPADAKKFFAQFSDLENWKTILWDEFKKNGRIGTSLGNYLYREETGELSDKEKRSSVSQVVQGTASLIFKKMLLELSKLDSVQLKVPMHDAVLIQHHAAFDPTIVINLFTKVMTEHFQGAISGKASLAKFTADVA